MSLRWRLTLLSTLAFALAFVLFGTLAFFTVRYFMYETIDDNIQRQASAHLIYEQSRPIDDMSRLVPDPSLGTVFFTVIDSQGHVYRSGGLIPFSDEQFSRALDGEIVKSIETLHDGSRIRVILFPITHRPSGQVAGVMLAASPLALTDELLQDLRTFLVVSGLILLAGAMLGSYLVAGRALRAVERITHKAHQIEVSQDLSQRIPEPPSDDEIGLLVRTFNSMLARLQGSFEAQRRFIADSSHELRTPLTVIRSNLHLLKRSTDPEERRELFAVTEAEVSRLNGMVNDLLYIAHMQAGHRVEPVLRPVELESLLLEVFARARAMAATKGQHVSLAHEDVATALGDAEQLQHLLLNLVDNAVKYTPVGGSITLGLWNEGDTARIDIGDTGPGIAPAELPYIFERFFRTQDARDTVRSGSGLGLSIVKSIATAHGGRVEVLSEPGKGSTFRLRLPLQRPLTGTRRALPSAEPATAHPPGSSAAREEMIA